MEIIKALKSSPLSALDTELLLSASIGKNRTWVCAHKEYQLSGKQISLFESYIRRRMHSEPVAYILGCQEFFGRSFTVSSDVLIPRSSTEGLIEATKTFLQKRTTITTEVDTAVVSQSIAWREKKIETIVDVCTGSGCIAVTLALEIPDMHIIATDISPQALEIAKKNAHSYNVSDRITFKEGDRLEPILDLCSPFLIITNPPYVPSGERPMDDVFNYEPHIALFSGEDGADLLSEICSSAKENPYCQGIILECRTEQAKKLLAKE
ncbi:MAG: peptide chain release factor N(5)-glutamine methyltransferase [bacterium]|nr:peptide chain release factor N(5)-glutamine methyltransferase [bacterium]